MNDVYCNFLSETSKKKVFTVSNREFFKISKYMENIIPCSLKIRPDGVISTEVDYSMRNTLNDIIQNIFKSLRKINKEYIFKFTYNEAMNNITSFRFISNIENKDGVMFSICFRIQYNSRDEVLKDFFENSLLVKNKWFTLEFNNEYGPLISSDIMDILEKYM